MGAESCCGAGEKGFARAEDGFFWGAHCRAGTAPSLSHGLDASSGMAVAESGPFSGWDSNKVQWWLSDIWSDEAPFSSFSPSVFTGRQADWIPTALAHLESWIPLAVGSQSTGRILPEVAEQVSNASWKAISFVAIFETPLERRKQDLRGPRTEDLPFSSSLMKSFAPPRLDVDEERGERG